MARLRWLEVGAAVCAMAAAWGCGYVGEPMPPLLNIPKPVSDLRAMERADRIIVEFTVPVLTTEGAVLKRLGRLELRAGPGAEGSFNTDAWAATAKAWDIPLGPEAGRFEFPASDWVGREIILAMKAFGTNGRDAGWSNLVVFTVVPPLEPPQGLKAVAVLEGVRLSWMASAPSYRVFRREGLNEEGREIAKTDAAQWLDTSTQYGRKYLYRVQAFQASGGSVAESRISDWVEIVPKDTFPPAVPSGLKVISGTQSIELAWERSTEPDLAGYRIYRAVGDGSFIRLADTPAAPAYSDARVESGKQYRYAVSSFDALGNESARSEPVEIAAP